MNRLRFPLIAVVAVVASVSIGWGIGEWRKRSPAAPSSVRAADRGPLLFQMHCASCHGENGHGDGSSAAALRPPPRDFAARPWRFDASEESIRRVTMEGIPGTAMPSFRLALSMTDTNAVVSYTYRVATAGPIVEWIPSEEERLLREAGFTDLRGTAPPSLTLQDATGRCVRLADFQGRLVVLHFWGTGCTHCIKEIPELTNLEKELSGRLKVVHVCADETDPAVSQEALGRLAPGITSYTESNGLGLARFEVQSLPTVWLIDPSGKAIGRASGAREWRAAGLRKLIERHLPAVGGGLSD